jgi:GNAT superfamily N-acetyltransferase
MQPTLRRARPADAGPVAEIFLAARADPIPYLPDLHAEDEIRLWIRDIALPGHEVVVAEVGDRLAGFAALDEDELAHLYVHPDLQGQGIGDALLARVQELRPAGFRQWVFQRNTSARHFYERRGLRLVELTDGAGNEEREPDARYEWLPGELPSPASAQPWPRGGP